MTAKNIQIYCDGACSGNPGPGGWGAIVATEEKVTELGGYAALTTNNKMELTAALEALRFVSKQSGPVQIFTDSSYVINGITKWVFGWKKKGWVSQSGSPIANQSLWEELDAEVRKRDKNSPVSWAYVAGHAGIPGNEQADKIAVAFSQRLPLPLFQGSRKEYEIDLTPPNPDAMPEKKKTKKGSSSKTAYSYLSLIGTIPMRHTTWAECERRIKGQSNAKFKKALSAEEEAQILESWGVRLK